MINFYITTRVNIILMNIFWHYRFGSDVVDKAKKTTQKCVVLRLVWSIWLLWDDSESDDMIYVKEGIALKKNEPLLDPLVESWCCNFRLQLLDAEGEEWPSRWYLDDHGYDHDHQDYVNARNKIKSWSKSQAFPIPIISTNGQLWRSQRCHQRSAELAWERKGD